MIAKIKIGLIVIALTLLCSAIALSIGIAYRVISGQDALLPIGVSAVVETTPENEYYRGAFDLCFYLYTNSGGSDPDAERDCNELIDRVEKSDWYAQPSEGYEP